MRIFIGFLLFFICGLCGLWAQEHFKDQLFDSVQKKTFTYKKDLQLDVYEAASDRLENRPVILLVHGGGFAGGQRDGGLESEFMKNMAKRGYVGISMSYRLLRKGKGFGCNCEASEKERVFLEAAKDVYAASQYIIKHSSDLNIDPSKIILVGSSAGAEAILNAAFMQDSPAYKAVLEKPIKYAGLISFAGAVLDASRITKKNAIPSLLFHGKKDRLVPYGTAPHHYCSKKDPGFIVLDGSRTMARKIRKLGGTVSLVKAPKGGHDWASISFYETDLISEFLHDVVLKSEGFPKRISLKNPH